MGVAGVSKGNEELLKEIYKVLRVNDATNKASWWNIADEVVEWRKQALKQQRGKVLKEIERVLENTECPTCKNDNLKFIKYKITQND